MNSEPGAVRRVLVTRGAGQASKLSDGLRAAGFVPIEVPVLEIQPPASYAALDAAVRALASYDWLVLTSVNAVRVLAERADALYVSLRSLSALQVAAVGPATAKEAEAHGLRVALLPESYVAESLVAALAEKARGKRVLLARAESARDVIPDALRAAGAEIDVVDAYRNGIPAAAPEQLQDALAEPLAAATFTSSSSAAHLKEVAESAGVLFPLAGVPAISIGPITSATLRELGWVPAAEAVSHDIPGLIATVTQLLTR
ncbi:MAG: uroporphyrinogen-III synthase [Acidobacteriaceae bacterium]|nr:uroporphyrinogen-III synthase [Acidobacteriaceae bacterium]